MIVKKSELFKSYLCSLTDVVNNFYHYSEFQDTSHIQLDLVRLLTTNSLFVVSSFYLHTFINIISIIINAPFPYYFEHRWEMEINQYTVGEEQVLRA